MSTQAGIRAPRPGDDARLDRFFDSLLAAHGAAAARLGAISRRYRFGPGAFRLVATGGALADGLGATFAHLRLADDGPAELEIRCWDPPASGVTVPPPPWQAEAFLSKGGLHFVDTPRYAFAFSIGADTFTVHDRARNLAVFWARGGMDAIPYWERSFPFRTNFHWASASGPLQPCHAGAVGGPGGGVLVTGVSGAGKTTTTIACLEGGLRYAGDDYVLVDTGPRPTVYSLYNAAKFTDDSLARFPRLARAVWNPVRAPEHKALVYGIDNFPASLIEAMPIRALLLPRVTGGRETTLHPIAASQAIRAIAPTTIAHLPSHEHGTLAKLTRLCRSVPCFEIAAGTDLAGIPRAVDALIAQLAP